MKSKTEDINYLVKICLDLANIVDRNGENGVGYLKDLKLGHRALSVSLRRGVKAIVDLQEDYSKAIEYRGYAETGEKEVFYSHETCYNRPEAFRGESLANAEQG